MYGEQIKAIRQVRKSQVEKDRRTVYTHIFMIRTRHMWHSVFSELKISHPLVTSNLAQHVLCPRSTNKIHSCLSGKSQLWPGTIAIAPASL